jgi:hypothetical protein
MRDRLCGREEGRKNWKRNERERHKVELELKKSLSKV